MASPPPGSPTGPIPTTVFVGGLAPQTDEASLAAYFRQFGTVNDVIVKRDTHGVSKRYGFVTLDSGNSAWCAVSEPHTIDGKSVGCNHAHHEAGGRGGPPPAPAGRTRRYPDDGAAPPHRTRRHATASAYGGGGYGAGAPSGPDAEPTLNVHVKGLPADWGNGDLRRFFRRFGEILDTRVLVDFATGRSRESGFVLFHSRRRAAGVLGRHSVPGGEVDVTVAWDKRSGPMQQAREGGREFARGDGREMEWWTGREGGREDEEMGGGMEGGGVAGVGYDPYLYLLAYLKHTQGGVEGAVGEFDAAGSTRYGEH